MTPPADILSIAKSFVPRSQTWLYDEVARRVLDFVESRMGERA